MLARLPEAAWLVPISAALAAGTVVAAAFLPALAEAAEVAVYACAGVAMWAWRPLREVIDLFPQPHRRILAAFLMLMVLGQIDDDNRENFPFVSWRMYGELEESDSTRVSYLRVLGTTASGESVAISIAETLPGIGYGVSARLRRRVEVAEDVRDAVDSRIVWYRVGEIVRSIARRWERAHPETPLARVELRRHRRVKSGAEWRRSDESERVLSLDLAPAP